MRFFFLLWMELSEIFSNKVLGSRLTIVYNIWVLKIIGYFYVKLFSKRTILNIKKKKKKKSKIPIFMAYLIFPFLFRDFRRCCLVFEDRLWHLPSSANF